MQRRRARRREFAEILIKGGLPGAGAATFAITGIKIAKLPFAGAVVGAGCGAAVGAAVATVVVRRIERRRRRR